MSRTTLYILLFLVWSVVSWKWYTCGIKGHCAADNASETIATESNFSERLGPLSFKWNKSEAIVDTGWDSLRTSLLDERGEGKVLIISGPYYSEEESPSGYKDRGLARARRIKDLLGDDLKLETELTSHLLEGEADKSKRWVGARFKWVERNENVQANMKGALIYFPYKSDQKISNENIIRYLVDLAENLRSNTSITLSVVGHTDDKGSEAYNENLGMMRARSIKHELVALGVAAHRITTMSMGETKPLLPNDSEENKAKNRRTEIILND